MKTKKLIVLTSILIFSGCSMKVAENKSGENRQDNKDLLMATLYQQRAAEYDALTYQAFNAAKKALHDDMKVMGLTRRQCIVVDIDETLLDNSPYQAECILENISYPERWDEWINSASCESVPGALEFLNFASENGYEIFYVTNRKEKFRKPTLENLKKAGFPNPVDDHLLMRTETSSKQARRDNISENYKISMLIGDNLNDFTDVFYKAPLQKRFALVDSLRNEFGQRFIILPNAMYGSWVDAIFEYQSGLSEAEMDSLMMNALEGF